MKLKTYDTPWLMVRATTANRIVSGSAPMVMSVVLSMPPKTGSISTNTPCTAQKMP